MKIKIFLKSFVLAFIATAFLGFSVYSQNPDYNDQYDDEAARKKEEESMKSGITTGDPYYEKHVKGSWENDRKKKIKKAIEELKKEYGTDKFTKEILEKGPVKKNDESSSGLTSPSSDPYYDKNIKNSWQEESDEIKKQILEQIKQKVSGEEQKKSSSSPSQESSTKNPSVDEYYEKNIKDSWKKQRSEIVEGAVKNLMDDEAIETAEQRKKRLEKEKKEKEQNKGEEEVK